MKESSRCWLKIAEIPNVKFLEKSHEGLLQQRLYHQCMDIVTSALKECSKNPVRMTDATGVVRLVRTILLAHLADYPEQQLISCASHTSSPISIATIGTFGSNGVQKLRTKGWIMKRINFVRATRNLEVTDLQ